MSKEDRSVSACLAVYNGAPYLERALRSMVEQTLPALEILVVDDGSTDGSAEIAEKFPVRLIRQANAGIGAARKRLVEEAKGDWIAFNDHDDWWAPNRLERMMPYTKDPEVTLVYSGVYEDDQEGNFTDGKLYAEPEAPLLRHLLPNTENVHLVTTLLRRSTLLEIGNFDVGMRMAEDTLAYFMLGSRGKIVQVPERLAYIYKRPGSTSHPSRSVYEHDVAVYERYILPQWDALFGRLPADEQAEAKKLIQNRLGAARSFLATWIHWEGDRKGALKCHRQAVALLPSKGNWYRYLRSLAGIRGRPFGVLATD